eukprot:CAMPEP_0113531630 /NCGR_PEP_ID=MMETSP0015_2-20120614/3603_1 /TAXON_ID=2838 /ORGANISM="Odontella" /LENGTH=2326 /DNA_ID=CAMNT_0000430487 /DNA_START=10 /DNA_END=6990 /DNA_ORIENTATION=- /assembly_acc=CAM_ASM_000160
MVTLTKKCFRLSTQLSSVETLKHGGLSQAERCEVLLRVLRLLCATVVIMEGKKQDGNVSNGVARGRSVRLSFDDVGCLLGPDGPIDIGLEKTNGAFLDCKGQPEPGSEDEDTLPLDVRAACLEEKLSEPFALPSPARESLLSVAVDMLGKKGPLRSCSNAAVSFPGDDRPRQLLTLNWHALLRVLLRTAPYLDEHKSGVPPVDSVSRQSTVLRRTVHLIRSSRGFFDQGLRPLKGGGIGIVDDAIDRTAREVWLLTREDLLHRTHSNSCFRAIIVLYLFQPSRCSSAFYESVMSQWLECWSSIDRCPEYDYLWLVLFCRARKYIALEGYDWGDIRRKLLTQSGYWLQIPVGGSSSDKSFPRAAPPKSRGFPYRLKSFVGSAGGYQEGIDFVRKVSKLLIYCLGRNNEGERLTTPTAASKDEGGGDDCASGNTSAIELSSGTQDLVRFLDFTAPYFHPSNTGAWTYPLGVLLHYLSYDLCRRTALSAAVSSLRSSHPSLAAEVECIEPHRSLAMLPPAEAVAVLNSMLPLCQQSLYSKNGHVASAGESALTYLTHIDPVRVAPPFLDLAARALDVSSVTMSHQAPAALSALMRLVQPGLRRRPDVFLRRLPQILQLSLAGVDGNDQNKTLRTLIFYRNLCSWVPIGGGRGPDVHIAPAADDDGTIRVGNGIMNSLSSLCSSFEYVKALEALPESSFLVQQEHGQSFSFTSTQAGDMTSLLEETAHATSDWALSFLDRVFLLLRTAGEYEKAGKVGRGGGGGHAGGSYVASRHSSADARQARNFSRVLKETLCQVFAAMDKETYKSAVRSVSRFVEEETLPNAGKDAAALCLAVTSSHRPLNNDVTSSNPGLDSLVPILVSDITQLSPRMAIYRLRCLAGAVRYAGRSVFNHRRFLISALDYALDSDVGVKDRHLFKTGCKLLRHAISSQCESYALGSDRRPRVAYGKDKDDWPIGRSSQLRCDGVEWHSPSGEQIDFVAELLDCYVMRRLGDLGCPSEDSKDRDVDVMKWRRALRVLRYALRGCSGILLDAEDFSSVAPNLAPDRPNTTKMSKQQFRRTESMISAISADRGDTDEDLREECALGPYERATITLLLSSSEKTQKFLSGLRGRLSTLLVSMLSLIGKGTANSESGTTSRPSAQAEDVPSTMNGKDWIGHPARPIYSDAKICKEVITSAQLLLTRRSANYRASEDKNLWRAQKEMLTDYALSDMAEFVATSLQCAGIYGDEDGGLVLYKDGEDGGKTVPRRLLVNGVDVFHRTLQRDASYGVPRRLRRQRWISGESFQRIFTHEVELDDVLGELTKCKNEPTPPSHAALDSYEALLHGLFALSCHTNVDVQGCAVREVDYCLRRFGWTVRHFMPRLLDAISLHDDDKKGWCGIPSCKQLSEQVDARGERKRLAEVLKGVCSILALPRTIKEILATESNRLSFVRTILGTQELITLLPSEEMQKMVHYFQAIFSQFRSKFYCLPRILGRDQDLHEECVSFLLSALAASEENVNNESDNGKGTPQEEGTGLAVSSEKSEKEMSVSLQQAKSRPIDKSLNWRNRLTLGWFVTSLIDETDLVLDDPHISSRVWTTAFDMISKEIGQPLQRVAIGLMGRLVTLSMIGRDFLHLDGQGSDAVLASSSRVAVEKTEGASFLRDRLLDETFCRTFGNALVFDHKEDTSVGGGHHAQWSAGVEEILRDASANVAPKTLFPFQRTSRSSATFKVSHAQLLQASLIFIGKADALTAAGYLLDHARELAGSPPSEDQRNQLCTSAEIFAGVCRAMLQMSIPEEIPELWKGLLLPFLDDAIAKVPISHQGSFFDASRYGIHHFPPRYFFDLTQWIIEKIAKTLWQKEAGQSTESTHSDPSESISSEQMTNMQSSSKTSSSADGFTTQSKWLFLVSSILIELDGETDLGAVRQLPWYTESLLRASHVDRMSSRNQEDYLLTSWTLVSERLLPLLLNALGHPYEKCREHIAGCLFRICYCHRKISKTSGARAGAGAANDTAGLPVDPGKDIVDHLVHIDDTSSQNYSFKSRHHALITARKFIVYCVHLGDAKSEFSDYVIPLLPLCFRSLKVKLEVSTDDGTEVDPANRMLEAEVVKGYRYQVAEVSCSCIIAYGRDVDLSRVLDALGTVSKYDSWQIRQAAANFLRCFQGGHKFLFDAMQSDKTMKMVTSLLVDERREVSSAAMAALTGILASMPLPTVSDLVAKYVRIANKSVKKRKKKSKPHVLNNAEADSIASEKEKERARKQQRSVYFLCAAVLSRPYDTPQFVPLALEALSKHSYERTSQLGVREVVKMCCGEFKRTHMSDNWDLHRKQFSQEQLEALQDVVSTPHYYA